MMCISVDLPEPDGPGDRDELALADHHRNLRERADLQRTGAVDLLLPVLPTP